MSSYSYQPIGGSQNDEGLTPIDEMTGEELQRCMLEHEIFSKNLDILSKNESDIISIIPLLELVLRRHFSLRNVVSDDSAKQSLRVVCIYMNVELNEELGWRQYDTMARYLRGAQYSVEYDPNNNTTHVAALNLIVYSFEELRRRMYELKCDCMSISYARYTAAKLRAWKVAEQRDLLRMYFPLGLSSIALCVSLITLWLKVAYKL